MLNRLRQSAAGTLSKILITLLVASFALWGIGDVFGQNQNPSVAQVGGESIDATKFLLAFQQNYLRARINAAEQGKDITVEQARRAGLDRQVLSFLISRSVLEQNAEKMGLSVSRDRLLEFIQEDETFKGAFGQFDATVFQNTLQGSNLTEEKYLTDLEQGLTREQLLTIFSRRPAVPRALVDKIYSAQNEKRTAEYVILKAKSATKKKASDEALQEFIDSHETDFSLPEKRQFQVLLLEPDKFTKEIKISAKDLQEEYKNRLTDFQTPEQRKIEQLVFTNKKEAAAAHKKIKAGTRFSSVAKKRGLSKGDWSLGWRGKGQYISEKIELAATKLSRGKVSVPIQTDLGWVVLRVAAIKKAKTKSFASVRAVLKKSLAYEQILEVIDELHDLIEDEIASGETFKALAKKYKLQFVQSKTLTRESKMPTALKSITDISARVWTSEQEGPLESQASAQGGFYWLTITSLEPRRVQTLSEARTKAQKKWQIAQNLAALKERAQTISQQVAQGASLRKASKLQPKRTPPLARFSNDRTLSPILLEALFRTTKGGVFFGASKQGDIIIARVAQITQSREGASARTQTKKRLAKEMNELSANEALGLYISAYQKSLGVDVNAAQVELALERLPPSSLARQ